MALSRNRRLAGGRKRKTKKHLSKKYRKHHHKKHHSRKTKRVHKGGFGPRACPFVGKQWNGATGGNFFKLGTPIGVVHPLSLAMFHQLLKDLSHLITLL